MKTATTRLMALFHTLVQLHTSAPPVAAIRPYSTCAQLHYSRDHGSTQPNELVQLHSSAAPCRCFQTVPHLHHIRLGHASAIRSMAACWPKQPDNPITPHICMHGDHAAGLGGPGWLCLVFTMPETFPCEWLLTQNGTAEPWHRLCLLRWGKL